MSEELRQLAGLVLKNLVKTAFKVRFASYSSAVLTSRTFRTDELFNKM